MVNYDAIRWPPGTEVAHFENLEGMVLFEARLRGRTGRDTTGLVALDTGAGYLALDLDLARALGLTDRPISEESVSTAEQALPRLVIGGWQSDQVEPVLTVDARVVRRVSDRPVIGLVGQKPLRDRAVWIDYQEQVVAFIPAGPADEVEPDPEAPTHGPTAGDVEPRARAADASAAARSRALLSGMLSGHAVPVRFDLVGDGKMLVRGVVSDPRPPRYTARLNLLVDTGATKCVLFEDALAEVTSHAAGWPAVRGFAAPTLIGTAEARITRVPVMVVEAIGRSLRVKAVDFGIVGSELRQVLSRVTREPIAGLIGYSFLKRFRVVVDYPARVLWLDPIPNYRDDRPLEYCHVGLQLERRDSAVVVVGVAADSPADRAGIQRGDEVVALDGDAMRPLDLVAITRRMEGEPGQPLTLVMRRHASEHTYRLRRRRLL